MKDSLDNNNDDNYYVRHNKVLIFFFTNIKIMIVTIIDGSDGG